MQITIRYIQIIVLMDASESTTMLPSVQNEELSPLEQDVLDEYERLADNMKKVGFCYLILSSSRVMTDHCASSQVSSTQWLADRRQKF